MSDFTSDIVVKSVESYTADLKHFLISVQYQGEIYTTLMELQVDEAAKKVFYYFLEAKQSSSENIYLLNSDIFLIGNYDQTIFQVMGKQSCDIEIELDIRTKKER